MPLRQPLSVDLEAEAAIEKLSPAARRKLKNFARQGARRLANAGESVVSDEHEQILHDAITDTLSRVAAWDRRLKMGAHLHYVIKRRIWNGVRSARKKMRVPIDVLDLEEGASGGSEPEVALGRAEVTQLLKRVLRERAAGDREVLSILDAYVAEEFDRRAVMSLTGLALQEFINARRRLDRLCAGLPPELRLAALAACAR